MEICSYQRKPIVVEAVQVTDENLYEVAKWCEGDVHTRKPEATKYIKIQVLNPQKPAHSEASVGNWVLKSDTGYKVFSDSAFDKGWEKVPYDVDAPVPAEPLDFLPLGRS